MKYLSMFFIGSSNHDKQHMFILTLDEVFFEKKPWISLVVHLHLCSYGKRKKLEPSGRKGMESIEDSMDSNVEEGSCDEEQCMWEIVKKTYKWKRW